MPLPPDPPPILIQAECLDGPIDLKAFLEAHPAYRVLCRSPLVVEREGTTFYLSRFGVVVAWQAPPEHLRTLREDLLALPGAGRLLDSAADRLIVHPGADADRVGFNEIWLKDLSPEKIRVVSRILAQSVALDHFELEVSAAMAKTQPLLASLRRRGRIAAGHREVLKIVGFAMDVRGTVLNGLTLFEDPPETWEDEALDRLHRGLAEQFDLPRRGAAVSQKLDYLSDSGQVLMDLLSTRKAHQLEWIVIVLIFIETATFLWTELILK